MFKNVINAIYNIKYRTHKYAQDTSKRIFVCPVSCFNPPPDTVVLILRPLALVAVSGPCTE